MPSKTRYAAPFHEAILGNGRRVGLDAYLWPHLQVRYRVVLLVQPADRLTTTPPPCACRLPALAGPEEQARDLERVATARPPTPEVPRPSLLRRLAELLVPPKLLSMADEEPRVPEEAQARSLARLIGQPRFTGRTLWALLEDDGEAILPANADMARIYAELRRRDPGYLSAEEHARAACGKQQR
jgi:hypothetical protein